MKLSELSERAGRQSVGRLSSWQLNVIALHGLVCQLIGLQLESAAGAHRRGGNGWS